MPVAELVLEMANEPPTSGWRPQAPRRPTAAAWRRCCAGAAARAADVLRSFFSREASWAPAVTTGPVVWGISPVHARHRPRRADLRDAPRRHRRASGRRQRSGAGELLGRVRGRRRHAAHGRASRRRSCCEGERVRGVELRRRHGDRRRRSSCRRATRARRSSLADGDPPPQAAGLSSAWRTATGRGRLRVEDRRDRRGGPPLPLARPRPSSHGSASTSPRSAPRSSPRRSPTSPPRTG